MNGSMIHTARFGSGSTILKARGSDPIGLDEITALAPAIFADGAHESRSKRYSFIPTRNVLEGLWAEGFRPFEVRQGGSRDELRRGYTKHMIRFRQVSDFGSMVAGSDRVFPEVILVNSHDGTSAYRLAAGLFRCVCTNGLVAGDVYEDVRIPHKGEVVQEVIEGAYRVTREFPAVLAGAEKMAAIDLTPNEAGVFAAAAAELRWEPETEGETVRSTVPLDTTRLLAVRRGADAGSDLWKTFNRVQEAIVNGGAKYVQRDERGLPIARRTVRPVNGIDANRQLNRALWTLAEGMAKLKNGEPLTVAA